MAFLVVLATLLHLAASKVCAKASPAAGTGDIALRVAQFGLAHAARAGDWAGIELEVTDSASQPRNVLLRIAVKDGDGDTALMRRVIVANPGVKQSAWLYARLPFNMTQGSTFNITAHEAIDTGADAIAADEVRYVPGRLLAGLEYPVNNPVPSLHGLIGVIGRRAAGLDQYSALATNAGYAATGHEYTQVVSGLSPSGLNVSVLPDRWMGLMPFEVLAWTGAALDEQTPRLNAQQAEAIREWVKRGGHLVVVLPPAGQSWVDVPENPLADIVPDVSVERRDGVDLDAYRQLLTRRADVALPNNAVVHLFTARPGADRSSAIPILNTPDGRTVVMRRLVGTGAVTLIGLDLTTRTLSDVSGALHADLFWNRVLGKRLPLMSQADFDYERLGDLTPNASPQRQPKWMGGRAEADFDAGIGAMVTKSARAAAGLLLAFVIFLLYWLLAGPVGFYALKERNLKHYSWLGFLGATALFTAIAWGGANVLRTRRIEGQHVTFVDHVYGQSNQRMRSWFTLLLPTYGEQVVSVGEERDLESWRNTITSWESFGGTGGSGLASFPDARAYETESRSPWRVNVPTRATTKTFQADWAGGLPGNWGMIAPQAADGQSVSLGEELQLVEDPTSRNRWKLSGTLTHSLPSAMEDVVILVVLGQDNLPLPRGDSRVQYSNGLLQARVWDFAYPGNKSWKPGDVLDLFAATGSDGSTSRAQVGTAFFDKIVPRAPAQFGGTAPGLLALNNVPESMIALALFGIIPPPDPQDSGTQTLARRSAAHTYDLSRWFTQPCIIVIGQLSTDAEGKGIETPLPVSIDGSPTDSTRKQVLGRTVVRWVYPLPAAPPAFAVPASGTGLPAIDGLGEEPTADAPDANEPATTPPEP